MLYVVANVKSDLSPQDFRAQAIVPLAEALEREGVGTVIETSADDEHVGYYCVNIKAINQNRAIQIAHEILGPFDIG
jgi:hypothetical protein